MNLQEMICDRLKDHAALVNAGIESKQALDIVSSPAQKEYLEECLDRLTIDQMDKLVKELANNLYAIEDKKAVYVICGVIKESVGYKVCFTDCVLQIDSKEVLLDELTNKQMFDVLSSINKVI